MFGIQASTQVCIKDWEQMVDKNSYARSKPLIEALFLFRRKITAGKNLAYTL
jgi:hypothetical protein